MSHRCHADGCTRDVPPRMLMCADHWRMVPMVLRGNVWRAYVEGQEIRKDPTPEYLKAAQAAIDYVAECEGR